MSWHKERISDLAGVKADAEIIDRLRARVAELERERDEARAERDRWRDQLEREMNSAEAECEQLAARVAELERDRERLEGENARLVDVAGGHARAANTTKARVSELKDMCHEALAASQADRSRIDTLERDLAASQARVHEIMEAASNAEQMAFAEPREEDCFVISLLVFAAPQALSASERSGPGEIPVFGHCYSEDRRDRYVPTGLRCIAVRTCQVSNHVDIFPVDEFGVKRGCHPDRAFAIASLVDSSNELPLRLLYFKDRSAKDKRLSGVTVRILLQMGVCNRPSVLGALLGHVQNCSCIDRKPRINQVGVLAGGAFARIRRAEAFQLLRDRGAQVFGIYRSIGIRRGRLLSWCICRGKGRSGLGRSDRSGTRYRLLFHLSDRHDRHGHRDQHQAADNVECLPSATHPGHSQTPTIHIPIRRRFYSPMRRLHHRRVRSGRHSPRFNCSGLSSREKED